MEFLLDKAEWVKAEIWNTNSNFHLNSILGHFFDRNYHSSSCSFHQLHGNNVSHHSCLSSRIVNRIENNLCSTTVKNSSRASPKVLLYYKWLVFFVAGTTRRASACGYSSVPGSSVNNNNSQFTRIELTECSSGDSEDLSTNICCIIINLIISFHLYCLRYVSYNTSSSIQ